jgi:hypothetical protein
MTRRDYQRAADMIAAETDALKQAVMWRTFRDYFLNQSNFDESRFTTACKIIDPIAGLRPKRAIKPPKSVIV